MNHDRTRILTALHNLLPNASVTESQGSFFWFAAGDEKKRLPFLTLLTRDEYDVASRLSRPGVYRLNVPLSPRQYRECFGSPPAPQAAWQVLDTGVIRVWTAWTCKAAQQSLFGCCSRMGGIEFRPV